MSSRLIIAAQAGVVLGLLGLCLYQARQLGAAHRELEAAALSTPDLPTSTNQRPARLRLQQLPPINIRTHVQQLDWRSVESEDYATYVANLREIRCPEDTIRDIILADINKLFAAKRRAIAAPARDWEFWRHPDEENEVEEVANENREREASLVALERERRQLVTRLLGDSAVKAELEEFTQDAFEDRAIQFLSPEKRQALAEALARRRAARDPVESIGEGGEAADALATADKAFSETLEKLLTPEELEQYAMRSSPLSRELRSTVRGFGASREEFETLFRLEREAIVEREAIEAANEAGSDPQAAEKLEALELEREQKVKEALGPNRYADYQRTRDPDYQTLYGLALDHEMSPDLANQVWEMRGEVAQQTSRIRADPLLTPEQKRSALDAIRGETQAAVVDVLGEPLLREYQREGGEWWVQLTELGGLAESEVPPITPAAPELPDNTPQQAQSVPVP